jgi:hypothetical protein
MLHAIILLWVHEGKQLAKNTFHAAWDKLPMWWGKITMTDLDLFKHLYQIQTKVIKIFWTTNSYIKWNCFNLMQHTASFGRNNEWLQGKYMVCLKIHNKENNKMPKWITDSVIKIWTGYLQKWNCMHIISILIWKETEKRKRGKEQKKDGKLKVIKEWGESTKTKKQKDTIRITKTWTMSSHVLFGENIFWKQRQIPNHVLSEYYMVLCDQHNGSPWPYLGFLDLKPLLFHSSSSTVIFTRLSGPRSRPTTSQKIWERQETKPGPLNL